MVLWVNAQTHFTDSTANWTVLYAAYCDASCNPSYSLNSYSIQGDTSINSNDYQKIYTSENEYYGAIRTENLEVFILPDNAPDEVLLYDFSLNLGDMYYSPFFNISFEVMETDSISDLNGQKHKIIYFDDYENDYIGYFWIEGIGSSGGLLKPIQINDIFLCGCGHTEDRDIVCFHRNDTLIYRPFFDDCYPLDEVNIEEIPRTELLVYPNPTPGRISIQAENLVEISVFDLQGKQIYKGKETELDLSKNTKGIYIIKVITDKQSISRKLIKQ